MNGSNDPGSGILTIGSGATFNDQTTSSGLSIFASNFGGTDTGATAVVNNLGTFTKSGSAATSTISTTFNNSGTVNVQSGTLNLSGGGTDVGASYAGAGTIQFGGGTRTLDAASSITAANAIFSGGTTTINGTYNVSGTTTVSGGTATLAGTLSSLGNALSHQLRYVEPQHVECDSCHANSIRRSSERQRDADGIGSVDVVGRDGERVGDDDCAGRSGVHLDRLLAGWRPDAAAGRHPARRRGRSVPIQLNGSGNPGSGTLTIGSGATFNDQTTSSGLSIFASNFGGTDTGATAVVNNLGTFTKSGSAATSTISTDVQQQRHRQCPERHAEPVRWRHRRRRELYRRWHDPVRWRDADAGCSVEHHRCQCHLQRRHDDDQRHLQRVGDDYGQRWHRDASRNAVQPRQCADHQLGHAEPQHVECDSCHADPIRRSAERQRDADGIGSVDVVGRPESGSGTTIAQGGAAFTFDRLLAGWWRGRCSWAAASTATGTNVQIN